LDSFHDVFVSLLDDNRFWMDYRRDSNKLEDALLKILPSAGTDGRQYGPE
jgi:hypothetical protein